MTAVVSLRVVIRWYHRVNHAIKHISLKASLHRINTTPLNYKAIMNNTTIAPLAEYCALATQLAKEK